MGGGGAKNEGVAVLGYLCFGSSSALKGRRVLGSISLGLGLQYMRWSEFSTRYPFSSSLQWKQRIVCILDSSCASEKFGKALRSGFKKYFQ